jgi:hypothetical protein
MSNNFEKKIEKILNENMDFIHSNYDKSIVKELEIESVLYEETKLIINIYYYPVLPYDGYDRIPYYLDVYRKIDKILKTKLGLDFHMILNPKIKITNENGDSDREIN